ncbi:MAG TPA: pitrilysin family protein, partial [Myxococcota bacterium]|nr:pitrilysin family protein [Myxococcota bacterium]
ALRMRGILDSQAAWKSERPAIEQEVAQDLSNPQYVLNMRLLAAAFAGTPYAHDALGTRESFERTTGSMLKRFHDSWYAPNNAVLVIVGDVEPRAALASVERLFRDIPRKALPPRARVDLRPLATQTLRGPTDLPYGVAVLAFRMPGYRSGDYAAAEVLGDALASQRGRLYKLVLEGKALSAGFSISFLPDAGLGFASAAFPRGADGAKLLAEMRGVLADIAAHGVPGDLVTAAKRGERAQAELQKNSIPGLAAVWSETLAVEGRSSPDEELQAIERVTPGDVARLARRALDPEHALAAILTPQSSGNPVSSSRFGGKESFTPARPAPAPLPGWARAAVERIAVPPWTLAPVSTRLPNGIQLIVQPESISDTVSVYGHVRNRPSLEVPAGREGLSGVLEQLFSYGTTTLDQARFQKALDDIGASESAGADFSLQVLTEHFARGMELLAQNELAPALPESAFDVVRRETEAALPGELQSPGFLSSQALKAALLPPGDPELRHATPASLRALTLADLRAYYRRAFRPDLTTIVVIGNISPQRAQEVVERTFGAWRAQGDPPQVELPPVPESHASTTAVPDASRVQVKVMLAETLAITRSDPDYEALQLGNAVLGGGFLASRLYHDLRERAGLAYYVGSSFDVGRTRALYVASYACDPPKVSRARAIIERDLRDMQTTRVDARALRQAKALLLKRIPLAEASVDGIAGGLLERVALGLPLDEPRQAAERY